MAWTDRAFRSIYSHHARDTRTDFPAHKRCTKACARTAYLEHRGRPACGLCRIYCKAAELHPDAAARLFVPASYRAPANVDCFQNKLFWGMKISWVCGSFIGDTALLMIKGF